MGNEVSTVGGAIATAATSVAAGVTLGQVDALNQAVVDCAEFTARHAEKTTVRYVGETAAHAVATAGVAVAAGMTFGQVEELNQAMEDCAISTAHSAVKAGEGIFEIADEVSDSVPVVAHVKGGILYAVGENARADKAMKSGTRSLGTIAGGVAGFAVGGPVGAVAGGVTGGAAMDGIITGFDSAVHDEFRPYGQIAAWDAVANAKSRGDTIGGVVGGVMIPVMDGAAGLGAGKVFSKWKLFQDLKIIKKFNVEAGGEGCGVSASLDETCEADLDRNLKTHEEADDGGIYENLPPIKEVMFEGQSIPARAEAIADEHRGDDEVLQPGRDLDTVCGPLNDVYSYAEGDRACNFVSNTSKDFGVARHFGSAGTDLEPGFGLMKLNAERGIDVQLTADMLDRLHPPYPGESEVSVLIAGIHPENIEGVLVNKNGALTWHPNPNYIVGPPGPPAEVLSCNQLPFIGATLVLSEELFHQAIMLAARAPGTN